MDADNILNTVKTSINTRYYPIRFLASIRTHTSKSHYNNFTELSSWCSNASWHDYLAEKTSILQSHQCWGQLMLNVPRYQQDAKSYVRNTYLLHWILRADYWYILCYLGILTYSRFRKDFCSTLYRKDICLNE